MRLRSLLGFTIITAMLAAPTLATAGADHKVFRPVIKANNHSFYGVSVDSERCLLAVKVYYFAPKNEYADSDEHRFRIKVEFAGGVEVVTRPFTNRTPGSRTLYHAHRTARANCWARKPLEIKGIRVVSCHGKKCKLPKLR